MTREQLEEIKKKYDLDTWIRQEAIRINQHVSVRDVKNQIDEGIVEILMTLRNARKGNDGGA